MATSVGFIGVGNMGNPMASNVLKAGFPMIVYDRNSQAMESLLQAGAQRATSAREVAPMIMALRQRAEAVRTSELDRFRGRYEDLDRRQLDMVEAVTKGVVAKLLHQPTVVLKDAAGSPRGDRLVAALRELFEIE